MIDPDYHNQLEQTVDELLDSWLIPVDPDVGEENRQWGKREACKIFKQNASVASLNKSDDFESIVGEKLGWMRGRMRQEELLHKTALLENRRLRNILKKNNIKDE